MTTGEAFASDIRAANAPGDTHPAPFNIYGDHNNDPEAALPLSFVLIVVALVVVIAVHLRRPGVGNAL